MKKTLNIILVLLLTLILSSCFTSKDDVDNAKKELGIIELDKADNDSGTNIDLGIEQAKLDLMEEEEKTKKIEIKSLTEEQFLELDDLSNENILDGEIEIKGKTISNVDKIIVTFENGTSEFPIDNYRLNQFKSGDDTFLYRAFSKYQTLDFGKNVYVFEAHSGDKISKLQLTLNVVKEEEKIDEEKVEQIYENISLNTLPTNTSFGTPVDLGNGKISYTDLKGLEIKKDVIPDLTCENLTVALADKISSWFYWNTCRPIGGDEGISFFIIRLDGDNYVYEKHYYLSYQGLHGTQELEIGTGVTVENIGEKNTELKEKNEEFTIIKIVDDLFKEILN